VVRVGPRLPSSRAVRKHRSGLEHRAKLDRPSGSVHDLSGSPLRASGAVRVCGSLVDLPAASF